MILEDYENLLKVVVFSGIRLQTFIESTKENRDYTQVLEQGMLLRDKG